MGKKFKALWVILFVGILNGQEIHEEISLPTFSGLEPSELKAFLDDWNKAKSGETIHQTSKRHDQSNWLLEIEYSPEWNDNLGCYEIKKTWIRLPKGRYQGLIPLGQNKTLPESRIRVLYFGKLSSGIRIGDEINRTDYFQLAEALRKKGKIELTSGQTDGKRLAGMIAQLDRTKDGDFWVEFHKPFSQDILICKLSYEELEYRAQRSGSGIE